MSVRSKKESLVFIGTYTETDGSQSEGVYAYRMDPQSGALISLEGVLKGIVNPSFLEIHPQQAVLLAVNEVGKFAGQPGGGVSTAAIGMPAEFKILNSQSSHGEDPCYISIEQTGRFALVANYTSGSIAMLPVHADGQLGPATDMVQHSGASIHPERQASPHAHCIVPDPANRFAIAADLGIDKLIIYEMELQNGKLLKHGEVDVPPGAGPRHLTFHPQGHYAYLINELDSTVIGYRYHAATGTFETLQTVSTLPPDFKGENIGADIHISPNGKYLYASNRGHDSMVFFQIDETNGMLAHQGHTSTEGSWPRNFAIDPGGSFILVANQKSDSVVTFRIHPHTGHLSSTGHQVNVSMPVCVKFASVQ